MSDGVRINSKVLVTGASGFLGLHVVEMLLKRGFAVRALVRKTSRIERLQRLPDVEICYGDVGEKGALQPAFSGVAYVIHAAADTSGSEEGARRVTVQGTLNILDLCAAHRSVMKLVYISSCSVYGVADCAPGQVLRESSALEKEPEKRGIYSWAKLAAEKIVVEVMAQEKLSAVCLRPGTIYGCGGENFSPMIGFSIRNRIFAVIGNGRFVMPLVYVDNLVDAVILAMTHEKSSGQIYNVVDTQKVKKKRYMDGFIRSLYPGARVFYIPYGFLSRAVALQEMIFRLLKRKPLLTLYRLASSQNPVSYDASKIMKELGWRPAVSFEKAVARIVANERELK